jgi:hypothetical protein
MGFGSSKSPVEESPIPGASPSWDYPNSPSSFPTFFHHSKKLIMTETRSPEVYPSRAVPAHKYGHLDGQAPSGACGDSGDGASKGGVH